MYALIGKTLGHSFSANFFNDKFQKENINETYVLAPLANISDLNQFLNNYPELKGFNVTIPYKEQIIPFLDYISPEANEIGAVNVVKIDWIDGKRYLSGFNTDAIGFQDSIYLLIKPNMRKALILGTGGASRAVEYILHSMGIATVKVSRNKTTDCLTYSELSEKIMTNHLIIVNTTPLGTWPDTELCPDIPYQFITPQHLCFDLVYNPEITTFLKKSAAKDASVKNGLQMLHLQALAAWKIWTTKK